MSPQRLTRLSITVFAAVLSALSVLVVAHMFEGHEQSCINSGNTPEACQSWLWK